MVSSKQRKVEDQLADENFQYNEESCKFTPSFIYNLGELGKLEEGRYGAFKALQSVNRRLRNKQEITVLVQAAVEKNLNQGFWRELTPDMGLDLLQSHVLPWNYIMSDSESTPLFSPGLLVGPYNTMISWVHSLSKNWLRSGTTQQYLGSTLSLRTGCRAEQLSNILGPLSL